MKALILNNKVVDLADNEFPVSSEMQWVDASDSVRHGWSYENGSFAEPVVIPPSYAELRAKEYPPMQDYLDGVVKSNQAQIDAYIAACLAVKSKFPKP